MNRLPLLCALLAACGGSSAHAPDAGAHDAGTHDAGVPDGGCSSKYDCVATQICVAGSCTAAASNGSCVADNGCPTGFICAAEMCAPGCVDNRDCRAPDVCNLEAAVCEAATVDAGVLVDAGTGLVDTGASQTIVSAAVAALTGLVELPIKTTLRGVWGRLEARQAIAAMVVPHCEPQVIVVAISDDVLDRVGVKNMIIGHDYLQRAEVAVLMGSLELRPEI